MLDGRDRVAREVVANRGWGIEHAAVRLRHRGYRAQQPRAPYAHVIPRPELIGDIQTVVSGWWRVPVDEIALIGEDGVRAAPRSAAGMRNRRGQRGEADHRQDL